MTTWNDPPETDEDWHHYHNPPQYPEGTAVEVRFPLTKEQADGPRENWPWLRAEITGICGPDEWQACVEDERVATPDGADLLYPLVFRDASEIRTPEPEAQTLPESIDLVTAQGETTGTARVNVTDAHLGLYVGMTRVQHEPEAEPS